MENNMKKIVEIYPAYDKRPKEQGDKDYGIGCCKVNMCLIGDSGAVYFAFFTNWYLPELEIHNQSSPSLAEIGFHSPKPLYEGQYGPRKDCPYIKGDCYSDSGFSLGDICLDIMFRQGSDGIWEYLEKYYNEIFKDKLGDNHANLDR